MTKLCFDCKEIKDLSEFPFRHKSKGTRHNRCKQCLRKIRTVYRPNKGPKQCAPIHTRFSAKVVVSSNGCWEWSGGLNKAGYGRFAIKKSHGWEMVLAHRYSYEAYNGKDPGVLFVCHRCDNPKCVNPVHLFLGEQCDNIADAKAKGRIPAGDAHYSRQRPNSLPSGDEHWARKRREDVNRSADGKFARRK